MNRDYAKVIGPQGEVTLTLNSLPVAMPAVALFKALAARKASGEFYTLVEVGREVDGVQTPFLPPEALQDKDAMDVLAEHAGVPVKMSRM